MSAWSGPHPGPDATVEAPLGREWTTRWIQIVIIDGVVNTLRGWLSCMVAEHIAPGKSYALISLLVKPCNLVAAVLKSVGQNTWAAVRGGSTRRSVSDRESPNSPTGRVRIFCIWWLPAAVSYTLVNLQCKIRDDQQIHWVNGDGQLPEVEVTVD